MLSVAEAEALIGNLVQPLRVEDGCNTDLVELADASDRILARAITSPLDFPHWDNSAMDGYAVRFADVQTCRADRPVTLTIIEDIPAGKPPRLPLRSGQAARILTGSMLPDGADTVVMQEQTRRAGDSVTILVAPPELGHFVRHRGAFRRVGDPLLPAGIILKAPELAILAAAQCSQVTVYRRPRVAILSTGSELVLPSQPLQLGQIVDSNQVALAALVAQSGGIPICLGIVPDRLDDLKAAIAQALAQADLILSSGGVSVGDYDYVEQILTELGATLHIRAVAIKPGKPLTVATFVGAGGQGSRGAGEHSPPHSPQPTPYTLHPTPHTQLYFGLPGNPVSALVTFWRFVQPALRRLGGLVDGWHPRFVRAVTLDGLRSDGKRETYLWGSVTLVDGIYQFRLAGGSHSSGNFINLAQTNALAIIPVGQMTIATNSPVQVLFV